MFKMRFADGGYRAMREHLLRPHSSDEQAAFAFFSDEAAQTFVVQEVQLLGRTDFASQKSDFIEIADDTRRSVIKQAHDQNWGVAEFHSHPFDVPAEFSFADYFGLKQTVPHMLWRLRGRSYVAVVVGPRDFDGLVWNQDASVAVLSHILDGPEEFAATGRSLPQWQ